MYTFIICIVLLVLGYLFYAKLIERFVAVDGDRTTPAYELEDGIDYVPMDKRKLLLIHFLNIAGLGPIFGAIQGALFGPAAFLWIVFGTIFAGGVHDFFSGFLSLRHNGLSMPGVISKYFGKNIRLILSIVMIISLILLCTSFTMGAADLLGYLTSINPFIWLVIIFVYFLIATLFPIDKIIAKVYPIFGILFVLMSVLILAGVFISPVYNIPELTTKGLYFSKYSIFPFLFVTIACGAISGFHSSQSPIVARCIKNEKEARPIFYGAMVLEGIVALIWAAVTMSFFQYQPQLAVLFGVTPSIAVEQMSYTLLGTLGVVLTVIGVVICPITSGDTALRSARLIVADDFNLDQSKFISRLKIALPIFIVTFALTFVDFSVIWRYFSWTQLVIAILILTTAAVYLIYIKNKYYFLALLPALFCLIVSIAYILQAPIGLGLNGHISNIIAVIVTVVFAVVFLYRYRFSDKGVTVEE